METFHQGCRTEEDQGQERAGPRFAQPIALCDPYASQATRQTVRTWGVSQVSGEGAGLRQGASLPRKLYFWESVVWGKEILPTIKKTYLRPSWQPLTSFRFSILSSAWGGLTLCPLSHVTLRAVGASSILTSQTQEVVKERASWTTCFCLGWKMKTTEPKRMNDQVIPFVAT